MSNPAKAAVQTARARFAKYPQLLRKCAVEAEAYTACVIAKGDALKQQSCDAEFRVLLTCVQKAAQQLGTRF